MLTGVGCETLSWYTISDTWHVVETSQVTDTCQMIDTSRRIWNKTHETQIKRKSNDLYKSVMQTSQMIHTSQPQETSQITQLRWLKKYVFKSYSVRRKRAKLWKQVKHTHCMATHKSTSTETKCIQATSMRLKQIELVFEALCSVGHYIVMELEGGILHSPAGYGASRRKFVRLWCVFPN